MNGAGAAASPSSMNRRASGRRTAPRIAGTGPESRQEPGEQSNGVLDEPRRIGVAAGGERLFHLCEVAGRERNPPAEAAVALLDASKSHKDAEQTGPEQAEAYGHDRCARELSRVRPSALYSRTLSIRTFGRVRNQTTGSGAARSGASWVTPAHLLPRRVSQSPRPGVVRSCGRGAVRRRGLGDERVPRCLRRRVRQEAGGRRAAARVSNRDRSSAGREGRARWARVGLR